MKLFITVLLCAAVGCALSGIPFDTSVSLCLFTALMVFIFEPQRGRGR